MKKRGLLALAIYLLTFLFIFISIMATRTVIIDTVIAVNPDMQMSTDSIDALLIVVCVICFIPLFFKLIHVFTGAKAFGFVCMLMDCYIIYTGISLMISGLNLGEDIYGYIFDTALFALAFISNAVSILRRSE